MIARLTLYSQTILSPQIKPKFEVTRSQIDSVNFVYEKMRVYKKQLSLQTSLLEKCENLNKLNLKIIQTMDSIDYSRIQEINKLNSYNANLRKKHKLELKQFKVKQAKRIILVGILGAATGFLIGIILLN